MKQFQAHVYFENPQSLHQAHALTKKLGAKKLEEWKLVPTESLELIRTLTIRGLGAGFLPKRIAFAESDLLGPYHATFPTLTDEIFLVYRKEVLKSEAGRALIQAAFQLLR